MLDTNTPSVAIRDLDLHFGDVKILQKLNLDIQKGEFLVLLGSSGCGKSTLLNCIAGLLDITDGQIFIGGENVTWAQPSERGIGMVFQSYALYPQMTVEGNLSFGLKNAKMPKDEIAKRVARAADVLQIEPLLKRKPGALSGGQRQRIGIARALYHRPSVLVLDEATSALDVDTEKQLTRNLMEVYRGSTVLFITHRLGSLRHADRILVIEKGSLIHEENSANVDAAKISSYLAV